MFTRFSEDFYKGKRVLITGHTGFKGSYMSRLLVKAGAIVTGYSLLPPTKPSIFEVCNIEKGMESVTGDIRDLDALLDCFEKARPEIVIHMAAQPIVRTSYSEPVYTYEANVMGTVNVLEAVRRTLPVKSVVIVTTDKVYLNREWSWGYRENEELKGFDPYSNSKSCAELVTYSYINSFFGGEKHKRESGETIAVSTCRAGNVLGGGDFARDRIIPDCVRAVEAGEKIIVRNPHSTRPYQHVLEPVSAYLMIAKEQYEDASKAGCYNVGPEDSDCLTTGSLVGLFCEKWNKVSSGKKAEWTDKSDGGPHEANFLKLDCSLIKQTFGWKPRWDAEKTLEKIVEWTKVYLDGGDAGDCMDKQIEEFLNE